MSDRLNRQQMKHDRFVDEVGTAYVYANSHRRPLFLAIGALVLLGVLAYAFTAWRSGEEAKAQAKLAEAIAVMDSPVTEGAESATPPQPNVVQYKSEDEKLGKAEPMFKQVVSEYSGSDAADVANLYLARIDGWRGKPVEARKKLESFIKDHPDHLLGASARLSLLEIRITAGEHAEVARELQGQLDKEDSYLPQDSILALLARSYEAAGDEAKARDTYQRIVNEFPDSPYMLDAQRKTLQG